MTWSKLPEYPEDIAYDIICQKFTRVEIKSTPKVKELDFYCYLTNIEYIIIKAVSLSDFVKEFCGIVEILYNTNVFETNFINIKKKLQ